MKQVLKRAGILLAVFAGSLVCFMIILNGGNNAVSTKGTTAASQPVLYIRMSDMLVNPMEGYKEALNEYTYRNSVTLLPTDRTLNVDIRTNGNDIEALSYEVTSIAEGEIIENGSIHSLQPYEETLSAEFTINTPINMNQEYMLKFTVTTGKGKRLYYYTRLLQRTGQNMDWYLGYVNDFYQNCVNKNLTDEMISQLETDTLSSNSSLHFVDLTSDKSRITWGNLETSLAMPAEMTILEINETTVSIGLDFIVKSPDSEGKTEYYAVNEYYRMRKAQEHVVLLDYERTTNEIFDASRNILTDRGINLGIVGKDVDFKSNLAGDIVVFEQAGELWQYNRRVNRATRIFSFRAGDEFDARCENDSHGFSISSVSDEGDTRFVVYGYMSSGDHEGDLGIGIYSYESAKNTTNELMFIETNDSYEIMKESISKLAYVNNNNQCFIYYNDTIFTANLNDKSVSVLKDNLPWNSVSVSKSQNLVAWAEGEQEAQTTSVMALNLLTGDVVTINAPEGDYIRTFGYVGEDLIYGMAHAADCYTDAAGNEMFAMYRVCLGNPFGDMEKDYRMENVYVSSVNAEDDLIILGRVQKEGAGFVSISEDRILHYEPAEDSNVYVDLSVTERKGTIVSFVFSGAGETTNLLSRYAGIPENVYLTNVKEPGMTFDNIYYYAYAKGGLYGVYFRLNEAINAADEQVGVVLDPRQRYIWERGNVKATNKIDPALLPAGLLEAPLDEAAVAEAVGADYSVLNLTGCSVSALRYQLSNGYAVVGKWSAEENKLIAGYDAFNIWVYDNAGGLYAIAFEDAETAFASQGNIFLSYIK